MKILRNRKGKRRLVGVIRETKILIRIYIQRRTIKRKVDEKI